MCPAPSWALSTFRLSHKSLAGSHCQGQEGDSATAVGDSRVSPWTCTTPGPLDGTRTPLDAPPCTAHSRQVHLQFSAQGQQPGWNPGFPPPTQHILLLLTLQSAAGSQLVYTSRPLLITTVIPASNNQSFLPAISLWCLNNRKTTKTNEALLRITQENMVSRSALSDTGVIRCF